MEEAEERDRNKRRKHKEVVDLEDAGRRDAAD